MVGRHAPAVARVIPRVRQSAHNGASATSLAPSLGGCHFGTTGVFGRDQRRDGRARRSRFTRAGRNKATGPAKRNSPGTVRAAQISVRVSVTAIHTEDVRATPRDLGQAVLAWARIHELRGDVSRLRRDGGAGDAAVGPTHRNGVGRSARCEYLNAAILRPVTRSGLNLTNRP